MLGVVALEIMLPKKKRHTSNILLSKEDIDMGFGKNMSTRTPGIRVMDHC